MLDYFEFTKNFIFLFLKVTVLRDGKELSIHKDDILVGEIIMIKSGMNIPVDGVIISGLGIQVDESAMTGESDHLNKESFTRCLLR